MCLLCICICLVGREVKVELTAGASEDFPGRLKRSPMGITAQNHVFHSVDGLPELISLSFMNVGGREDTMHQIVFVEVAVLNEVPNLARIPVPPPCDQLLELSERHAWPSRMASSALKLCHQGDGPTWHYRIFQTCKLWFGATHLRCPRCGTELPGQALPAAEFAGVVVWRDENPLLNEEERFFTANLVTTHLQYNVMAVKRVA
jgi:hypothetical protein